MAADRVEFMTWPESDMREHIRTKISHSNLIWQAAYGDSDWYKVVVFLPWHTEGSNDPNEHYTVAVMAKNGNAADYLQQGERYHVYRDGSTSGVLPGGGLFQNKKE
ncbi:hypothetical protein AWENTII_006423 [Aspergillus wentii]|nr:hypothetical protein MW887_003212 [Aspergillus wentii]